MKGKIPRIVMVVVALAMAMSLVAGVTTTVGAATDSWSRMALPSVTNYQMFPDSDIWDITAADDGTVFAIVEDTSGLRWFPMWSNFAVFKSTDGGYTWSLMWHIPINEPTVVGATGVPVEIVPQPGYDDTDAANQVVFMATDDNLYRSTNGGSIFTRIVPECQGVVDPLTAVPYDYISSLDVAENINVPGTYLAVVGVSSYGVGITWGEGVFTWNEDNILSWRDKRVGNVPFGLGYEALDVMFSPNYTTDGVIIAIVNDWNINDVVVTFWVSADGLWNGPALSDGPFGIGLVASPVLGARIPAAGMDVADDFDYLGSPYIFAFTAFTDVYRIKALPPLPKPTTVTATNAIFCVPFSDILVNGPVMAGRCYVGTALLGALTDVIEATQLLTWPLWSPSMKAPAGSWPLWLADDGEDILTATSMDAVVTSFTTSGVSKRIDGPLGPVYNGIGLMDDIAVTTDLPWETFYATIASVEASPNYADDDTVFVATASEWLPWQSGTGFQLSLWRQAPTGHDGALVWERLLQESQQVIVRMPIGKPAMANPDIFLLAPASTVNGVPLVPWTWVPKVDPAFENSNFMFLLGGEATAGIEQLWYSPDRGNSWFNTSQMPLLLFATALSETGWCVVDDATVLLGDSDGWVYKTTNRGNSWTDGAFTDMGVVTDLNVSPIYSEAGGAGTDKAVVAGVAYHGAIGAGLLQPRINDEVWISLDGAESAFTIVDSELMWDPVYGGVLDGALFTTANFDADWENNSVVYGAASGAMDNWVINPISGAVELQDTSEAGIYRAVVDLTDTQASTWELLYGAADIIAEAATPVDDCVRYLFLTDLSIGHEGSMYVPVALYHDDSVGTITPFSIMRFTLGGVARCLDGTQATTEWNLVRQGLGPYDRLWLLPVVPGSNILFSAAWDILDWRFKLATYEDTLCQAGPVTVEPADEATNVGVMVGEEVNVVLEWEEVETTAPVTYQWQVDDDSGFTAPLIDDDTTTETFAQVTDLENGFEYSWRVRVTEPVYSPWSGPYSFTTTITSGVAAPELLSPIAGAEGVALAPTFQWGGLGWASNYHIQVATDSAFSDVVIDEELGNVQAYQPASDLSKNTTYYWRVKATSDAAESNCNMGTFTTGPEAGVGTPAWVWVVIVIGAILAIAVIVLIVRTRRPV